MASSPKTPTPAQARLLQVIRDLRAETGRVPTFQEIGDRLGRSKVVVFETVKECQRRGHLDYDARTPRSIRLLDNSSPAKELAAWAQEVTRWLAEHGELALAARGRTLISLVG